MFARSFTGGAVALSLLLLHAPAFAVEVAVPLDGDGPAAPTIVWAPAPGEESSPAPPPRPQSAPRWYGWQTLAGLGAADASLATSLALFGAGNTDVTFAFMVAGISTHVFAGPIVHLAHGHVGRAAGSLGLVVGLTGLGFGAGALIGHAVESRARFDLGSPGAVFVGSIGGAIGAVTAHALDIGFLSLDAPRPPREAGSLHLVPLVSPRTAGLALGGTF